MERAQLMRQSMNFLNLHPVIQERPFDFFRIVFRWEFNEYDINGLNEDEYDEYSESMMKKCEDWQPLWWMYRSAIPNIYQEDCQLGYILSPSFEGLVIEIASYVRKYYGDYDFDSFYTDEERENHRTTLPIGNDQDRFGINPNFIRVSYDEIRQRWREQFVSDFDKKGYEVIISVRF